MSEMQSENFDIENKCSTIYVCRIVLQNFYIKIQKSNCNINFSNISNLPFDVMCFHLKIDVDDTVPNEPTINRFLEKNCELKLRKCFEIMLGSDIKRQRKKNRNISR